MAIGSTPGGSGHVVPDDPDHRLVTPEDTVAIARMEEARFREVGTKLRDLLARMDAFAGAVGLAPGSPADSAVAAFILDAASRTRGALDDRGAVLLRQAAADGDLHARRRVLRRTQVPEVAVELVVGVLAHRTRVEHDDVGRLRALVAGQAREVDVARRLEEAGELGAEPGQLHRHRRADAAAERLLALADGAVTLDEYVAAAIDRALIADVYSRAGTSGQVRASIEADCMAERERAAKAGLLPEASAARNPSAPQSARPGGDHGTAPAP